MKIAVVTNEALKNELLAQGLREGSQVTWLETLTPVPGADAYIDLLYSPSPRHINALKNLSPAIVLVNAVSFTLRDLPAGCIRLNGWPGFLKGPVAEAAGPEEEDLRAKAEKVFACFNKTTAWVPDLPGFVTARVLSLIINEAYFALGEEVSTKPDIDTAMKLGTNYPFGPFEWSRLIGLENIHSLLKKMAEGNPRYEPSGLLVKESLT